MYSFTFKEVQVIQTIDELKSENENSFFLWVWHASKIPPHIGLTFQNKYFSLKVKGKDENVPFEKIKRIPSQRNIGMIFVEVDFKTSIEDISSIFKNYSNAGSNHVSCLKPIQDVFQIKNGEFILSDLLKYLESKNMIKKVFSLNLESDFKGILNYSKEDIEKRLISLENAKRRQSLSENS